MVAVPGRLDVGVSGISCAACLGWVERAIAAVPGVVSVSVNLATERASITPSARFETSRLIDALDAACYPAATETPDLAVADMTCMSCVGRVERALLAVPGLRAAEVLISADIGPRGNVDI